MEKNEKYLEGIKSTGFELEFLISQSLIKKNWTVINNKYYIDDVQGAPREIDILAYKVAIKKGIQIYTVLIISCKKSSENAWVLLTKEKNKDNLNIDWNPVTLWSNQRILKLVHENYDWKERYIKASSDLLDKILSSKKHIFAFQEMKQETGKHQNDKAIFQSIISSMKSQNYEIVSLETRKKEDALYNFNLISVVDAPLLRINYGEAKPSIEEIDSEIYVGSYIINKKETSSRVHIIKSDCFDAHLPYYSKLHAHNIDQTFQMIESYYVDCLQDGRKVKLFIDEFNNKVRWEIYTLLNKIRINESVGFKKVGIYWDGKRKCAYLTVDDVHEDTEVATLNCDKKISTSVAAALKKLYRYDGEFYFESEIPF